METEGGMNKQCRRCHRELPADALHYYRNPASPDDLQSLCIECCKAERRARWSRAMKRRLEWSRQRRVVA